VKCHSVRGEGGTVGPDLAGAGQGHTTIDFAAAMWNKAPAMARAMEQVGILVPQLKAEEMADLLAYLYSIQYSAESGDPRRGQELLRGKGCLACHAVAGRGGSTAGDLSRAAGLDSQAGVIAALWNHVLIGERPAGRELSWPSLRPAEMADLAAFLQTLGRTR